MSLPRRASRTAVHPGHRLSNKRIPRLLVLPFPPCLVRRRHLELSQYSSVALPTVLAATLPRLNTHPRDGRGYLALLPLSVQPHAHRERWHTVFVDREYLSKFWQIKMRFKSKPTGWEYPSKIGIRNRVDREYPPKANIYGTVTLPFWGVPANQQRKRCQQGFRRLCKALRVPAFS